MNNFHVDTICNVTQEHKNYCNNTIVPMGSVIKYCQLLSKV